MSRFSNYLQRKLDQSSPPLMAVGIIGALGFPLSEILAHFLAPFSYHNYPLTIFCWCLCLPFIVADYWPRSLQKVQAIYWFLSLLAILPFYFAFMLLCNNFGTFWQLCFLTATFYLILLADWLSVFVILTLGCLLAMLTYYLLFHVTLPFQDVLLLIGAYIFMLGSCLVFLNRNERLQAERLRGMETVSSTIAHELRTPLLGLQAGLTGIDRYLPLLFKAYHLAREKELITETIRKVHLDNLQQALHRMRTEVHYTNTIIDMLLMNVRQPELQKDQYQWCKMQSAISESFQRFPFNTENQKTKFIVNTDKDFQFYGSPILMIHVLFNLIKNALYFTNDLPSARIFIWIEETATQHKLHFKDTGVGIAPQVRARLFNRFFTTTPTGAGIGLAFCREVIESFAGELFCESKHGEYTDFIIVFDKHDPNTNSRS